MQRFMIRLSAGALAALAVSVPRAMTIEEVVAKHITSHGGAEAWSKVQTMKISGDFRAFSLENPFTMVRKRDSQYYMDHIWNGHRVLIGHDGKTTWSDNGFMGQGAVELTGADLAVVQGDLHFATPLLDYPKNGYQAKLVGPTELEGIPTIAVELTRPDGAKETWYLDPTSYLEVARESPGSDFGRAMPQRTFYDDFRKVAGLVVAHHTETQWYTRDRVMEIRSIELNVPVDDALFRLPPPPGMGPVLTLAGSFKVAQSRRDDPAAAWTESQRDAKVEPLLRNSLLEERYVSDGTEIVRTLSYDRFRERYRLTEISSESKTMDVQEGALVDGKITLSNLDTGTTLVMFGSTIHQRTVIHDIKPEGFQLDRDVSTDGGKNWFTGAKATYTRVVQ